MATELPLSKAQILTNTFKSVHIEEYSYRYNVIQKYPSYIPSYDMFHDFITIRPWDKDDRYTSPGHEGTST